MQHNNLMGLVRRVVLAVVLSTALMFTLPVSAMQAQHYGELPYVFHVELQVNGETYNIYGSALEPVTTQQLLSDIQRLKQEEFAGKQVHVVSMEF